MPSARDRGTADAAPAVGVGAAAASPFPV